MLSSGSSGRANGGVFSGAPDGNLAGMGPDQRGPRLTDDHTRGMGGNDPPGVHGIRNPDPGIERRTPEEETARKAWGE